MTIFAQVTTDAAAKASSALSTNFTNWDWLIVGIYMAMPLAVGFFAYKFIHNVKGFVLGGSAAGTSLNIATYIGTGLGLVTLMYAAQDALTNGFAYVTLALISFAVGVTLGLTGIVISPLRKMGVLTIPEFFEHRFSRRVRILAGLLCVVAGVLNMGVFPKMGAIFITYVTGLADPEITAVNAQVIVNIVTSILIVLVLIYTVLGGMVSVIINDYIQFIVLSFGMGLGVLFCLTSPNLGWTRMMDTISSERGEMMFNPLADEVKVIPNKDVTSEAICSMINRVPEDERDSLSHDILKKEGILQAEKNDSDKITSVQEVDPGQLKTRNHSSYGWTWIAFNILVAFIAGFCWAPDSSRALTAKNSEVARKTFFFASPGQFARLGIPALWAIAAFTLIAQTPDLKDFFFPTHEIYGMKGPVHEPGAAMPLALGKIIPTGLLGLLVAGLLAAFLSTNDSYLLCWASVIARDVISPIRGGGLSGRQEILVIRVSVVLIGIFLLAWGIWYELPDSVWNYMGVSGTIFLSGCGIALLGGIYWKRASTVGAYASMISGLFAIAGLFLDTFNGMINESELLREAGVSIELTMPGVSLFNFALCAVVFVVFSLLFPDKKNSETIHSTDMQTDQG